jgi:P27 family predicted phage terminase small subunit
MKRGRKKDPENVVPGSQPQAVLGDVEPPVHLDDEAKAIFRRVASTLDAMKILTIGDLDVVASLAEVIALGRLHKARVDAEGATQTTATGREVYSGDYLIWRDMQTSERRLLNDLGLTPASRTRVAAAVAAEVDEFAEFMARRNETKGKAQD